MCRQISMETGKTTLLAVELPEGSFNVKGSILDFCGIYYIVPDESYRLGKKSCAIKTDFKVKYIGTIDQITEEVWEDIVESDYFDRGRERFKFYVNYQIPLTKTFSETFTATDSGLSLLEINNVLFENKHGKECPKSFFINRGVYLERDVEDYKLHYELWRKEETKILDPNRTHLFYKI